MNFLPGEDAVATVSNSKTIIGVYDRDSIATFSFTPATQLPPVGGIIEFKMPVWYGGTLQAMYPFDYQSFVCNSDKLKGTTKKIESEWDLTSRSMIKKYSIVFTSI